ncbi:MAG: hypothetical protein O7C98_07000 [Planctomycetota bacterium]|nr:hypothetical protein [Planctomycetota bacterium]
MRRFGFSLALVLTAAAASAGIETAHREALRGLVADLEGLAKWCTKSKLFADRNRTYAVLLDFDPDHAVARKWLGYRRLHGGWVRRGPYRQPRNHAERKHEEFQSRLAAVGQGFGDRIAAVVEASGSRASIAQSRALRDVFKIAPNHERVRALNGQRLHRGRWMLEETIGSLKRRRLLARTARRVLSEIPEPRATGLYPDEANIGVPWTGAAHTTSWRVVSTTSKRERHASARVAAATVDLFEDVFETVVKPRRGQVLFVVTDHDQFTRVLLRHPTGSAEQARKEAKRGSTWMPQTSHVVVWSSKAYERVEFAARQPLGSLMQRNFGITTKHGWAWEGFGLYLSELLTGTHTTHFVRSTRYAEKEKSQDDALWREIRDPDSNWFWVCRGLAKSNGLAELHYLLQKDVNAMTGEDLIYSYVFAAYLLEAHPEKTPDILRAIGKEEVPFHDAIPKALGMDLNALQERVNAWVIERQ